MKYYIITTTSLVQWQLTTATLPNRWKFSGSSNYKSNLCGSKIPFNSRQNNTPQKLFLGQYLREIPTLSLTTLETQRLRLWNLLHFLQKDPEIWIFFLNFHFMVIPFEKWLSWLMDSFPCQLSFTLTWWRLNMWHLSWQGILCSAQEEGDSIVIRYVCMSSTQ